MFWIEVIGWLAALFTMGAYSMRTMLPLRIVAIFANIFFAAYGYLTEIYPTLVLHVLLLPFNCYRLYEILRDRRDMRGARKGDSPISGLVPLLQMKTLADGDFVFRKGDPADHLYLLHRGQVVLEEIDVPLAPGDLFGEIAFFTDEKARTLSARCAGACEVAYIDEATFLKMYYQDPSFGLYIMKLTTRRLVDGMRRRPEAYAPDAR